MFFYRCDKLVILLLHFAPNFVGITEKQKHDNMNTTAFAPQRTNTFAVQTPAILQDVFPSHSVRVLPRGTYLFLPEEAADKVFFLIEGRVKVGTYGVGGKEITKAIRRDGELIGELAMLGENTHRNFAYTLEKVKVGVLSVAELQSQIRRYPHLHLELLRTVGQRLLNTEQRLESMVFKNSRSRIIEFLHRLGEQQGQRVGYEMLVRKFLTHQEIANLTATSRQTVTTILNELRNDNIITFNRKRLLIRDMEQLASYAA